MLVCSSGLENLEGPSLVQEPFFLAIKKQGPAKRAGLGREDDEGWGGDRSVQSKSPCSGEPIVPLGLAKNIAGWLTFGSPIDECYPLPKTRTGGTIMAKRVSPESALLMLHWQNSVCDLKGIWGKNLCKQIEKNNAIKNAQSALATARKRSMLTIFVNIGWRPGFPELPENQYYPLLQGAKDENKGIVGTWEVDVIDALRPMIHEPIVINFGSDGFEGTDLDRILRASNVGHLFVSGQCIEHVVATTIKRAANMGYNAILIKDATSGFTDANYDAMLDILPLYAKLISSAQFTLEAPYGGITEEHNGSGHEKLLHGQNVLASPMMVYPLVRLLDASDRGPPASECRRSSHGRLPFVPKSK
jgi:nicotinamidase-related amidase